MDDAQLTDRPVNRADVRGFTERPNSGLECARKEFVKSRIRRNIGVGRFGHIDLISGDKTANDPRGEPAQTRRGKTPGQRCQHLLGQKILRQYGQSIR